MALNRLYNFDLDRPIKSTELNDEFDQLIAGHNAQETTINSIIPTMSNLKLFENIVDAADYNSGALTEVTLLAAIAGIAGVNKQLYIKSGTWVISNNVVFPKNIRVVFAKGAVLDIATGITVTFEHAFLADIAQIFSGSGTVIFGSSFSYTAGPPAVYTYNKNTIKEAYPQWWGATGDGVTDDSTAIQAALNACVGRVPLYFPAGWYLANVTYPTGPSLPSTYATRDKLVISGAGMHQTYLKSYTSTGYFLTIENDIDNWSKHEIRDLTFVGDILGVDRTRGGVTYGTPTYVEGAQNTGGLKFVNVEFWGLDVGLRKYWGNLGNTFEGCRWTYNNYGIWKQSADKPVFGSTTVASTATAGDTTISVADSSVFEEGWSLVFDSGGVNQEYKYIDSIPDSTHIVLTAGLTNNQAAGNTVGKKRIIMQAGSDYHFNSVFSVNFTAAIYNNGKTAHEIYYSPHFEHNPGFALFYLNTADTMTEPSVFFYNPYFERNASSTDDIVIGSDTFNIAPTGTKKQLTVIRLDTCNVITMDGVQLPSIELVDSVLKLNNSIKNVNTSITKDAGSMVVSATEIGTNNNSDSQMYNYGPILSDRGQNRIKVNTIPFRVGTTYNFTADHLVFSETFSSAASYFFTGAGGLSASSVPDGVLFPNCAALTIPANSGATSISYRYSGAFVPLNKYLVVTVTAKRTAGTGAGHVLILGDGLAVYGDQMSSGWKTFGVITNTITTSTYERETDFQITAVAGSAQSTYRFAEAQILAFDSLDEAVRFLDSKLFAMNVAAEYALMQTSGGTLESRIFHYFTTPSSGTWHNGDMLYLSSPASGGDIGIVCTTGGTYGTLSGITASTNFHSQVVIPNAVTGLGAGKKITIAGVTGVKRIVRTIISIASSTVNSDSASGQRVLNVADTTNFNSGDYIVINRGRARQETREIYSKTSTTLVLATNLTYTHTAADGDTVLNAIVVDTDCDATVNAAAVAYSAPVWKTFGGID